MRILFVCLGNICRSPTAEAVMRRVLADEGLQDAVEVDSAGTGDWHVGAPPDDRAAQAARRRGVTLAGAGRQIEPADFERFDLVLAMDGQNVANLRALAPGDEARAKIRLLREFDPGSAGAPDLDVPDPYFGGEDGFDHAFDLVGAACRGLLDELRRTGRV